MMAGGAADVGDSGKAERFKALALPHLDDIYTLARYLLRSTSDADDAVQECYLRAFRHFDTFRGGPIKPWLFAILRNVCHASYAGGARLVFTADDIDAGAAQAIPVWREINDLSYRDIAIVIEAPIGTVMSRLARARGMLRDAWIAAEGRSGS